MAGSDAERAWFDGRIGARRGLAGGGNAGGGAAGMARVSQGWLRVWTRRSPGWKHSGGAARLLVGLRAGASRGAHHAAAGHRALAAPFPHIFTVADVFDLGEHSQ